MQYRIIFENTGTGTIIAEEDMTISLANNEFLRLSGYTREEVEGRMKWTRVVADPGDLAKMKAFHRQRRLDPGAAPKNYAFTLRDKLGNKKSILARVDMIPGTGRSVGSFNDITPVIEAQQALRENEATLRGVLETFEGYIYTCSENLEITYLNKNLEAVSGRPLPDRRCHDMVFKLDAPCGWCPREAVFSGKTIRQEFKCPHTEKWFYAVSQPVCDAENRVTKMQTVLMDIHERKQAEMDLEASQARLQKENTRLKAAMKDRYTFCGIVGGSRPMQKVYDLILKAAETDVNVIIYGESGTGKELVARAIHEMSARGRKRFVPVNCGAIPPNLLESEFFGFRKGAFTGAVQDRPGFLDHAQDGTLFLDELGEIDLNIQVKLLRVVEGAGFTPVGGRRVRPTNIRFVAATNRNLNQLVKQGVIREDFFYRIHILPIYLPPLRERKQDIPFLVDHFVEKHALDKTKLPLPGKVMDALQAHEWPGNVRELENTLHRYINLDDLAFVNASEPAGSEGTPIPAHRPVQIPGFAGLAYRDAVGQFEKAYITQMLDRHGWNRKKTAAALAMGRKTLYLKIKSLGISGPGKN